MSDTTASFKLESNLKQTLKASNEAIERGLEAIGMRAVTYTHRPKSQRGTPVVTSRLKNSIAWATQNNSGGGGDGTGGDDAPPGGGADPRTVAIGSNVEYAQIVEEGSAKRKARRMLRNALTDGLDEYKKILQASLEADE